MRGRLAVVGCSPDPTRDSHKVAWALQTMGHRVIPVNPQAREILGLASRLELIWSPNNII